MKTAKLIKKNLKDFVGSANLYKLSVPMKYDYDYEKEEYINSTEYVIVSASSYFVYETYIFPSDEEGNILDWGELDGSYQGGLNHEKALNNAGYTIEKDKIK